MVDLFSKKSVIDKVSKITSINPLRLEYRYEKYFANVDARQIDEMLSLKDLDSSDKEFLKLKKEFLNLIMGIN